MVVSKEEVFKRYLADARNSSHFVWFLADLQFNQTPTDGWIFAYRKQGSVTLVALEPLISSDQNHAEGFDVAWREFCDEVKPGLIAFVGVYEAFDRILKQKGFQSLQVGQEPWVDLSDCIPRGNVGKGVRSARNQALHMGITVEQWPSDQMSDVQRGTLKGLFKLWESKRLVKLGGFLNKVDPLSYSSCRKYFIAKSREGRVEGYLIATPVAGAQSYFLEDLILSPNAKRGTGELLTLEAMVALRDSGAKYASLGVISIRSIEMDSAYGLPSLARWALVKIPHALQSLYGFDGLEVFRKRFKPSRHDRIFLTVKNVSIPSAATNWDWFKAVGSLILAFEPQVRPDWLWFKNWLIHKWKTHPLSYLVAGFSLALFGFINHFGNLPDAALTQFGFSASVPVREWFTRSIVSDYLYFDPAHFWIWGGLYIWAIRWAEKTHRLNFLIPFFIFVSVFDDFINYLFVIRPFSALEPTLYHRLIQYKDVGGSLGLVTFFGLQLCQLKKHREIYFSLIAAGIVFGFVFKTLQFHILVLNLNHFLFFVLGYVVGKIRIEILRKRNSAASKRPPPMARSVATSTLGMKNQEVP